jgi:RIO kinase 1
MDRGNVGPNYCAGLLRRPNAAGGVGNRQGSMQPRSVHAQVGTGFARCRKHARGDASDAWKPRARAYALYVAHVCWPYARSPTQKLDSRFYGGRLTTAGGGGGMLDDPLDAFDGVEARVSTRVANTVRGAASWPCRSPAPALSVLVPPARLLKEPCRG